jgi:hypothetical protein
MIYATPTPCPEDFIRTIQSARTHINLWWHSTPRRPVCSGVVAGEAKGTRIVVDRVCDSSGVPSEVTLYTLNEDGEFLFFTEFERISDEDWDCMGIGRGPAQLQEAA